MGIIVPIGVLGGLGLFLGSFLAYTSKKFEVKKDPKISEVANALPGINCGACGYPGCAGYAEAVVNEGEKINLCAPGGSETLEKLSNIMGLDAVAEQREVARVMCGGDNTKTRQTYEFDVEIKTCATANLYFAGNKSCTFGCLGYGDCANICPSDAIIITEKGIAQVDEQKCTSCLKCIRECPKNIIKMISEKSRVTVKCSSRERGIISRKACDVACIACGICVKNCPHDAITIDRNLAVINPEKCTNCQICELKCPTNAIYSDIKEIKKAIIKEEKCIGCSLCKKVCPVDAIRGEVKQKHLVEFEKCIGCQECEAKCPVDAIEMEIIEKKD